MRRTEDQRNAKYSSDRREKSKHDIGNKLHNEYRVHKVEKVDKVEKEEEEEEDKEEKDDKERRRTRGARRTRRKRRTSISRRTTMTSRVGRFRKEAAKEALSLEPLLPSSATPST